MHEYTILNNVHISSKAALLFICLVCIHVHACMNAWIHKRMFGSVVIGNVGVSTGVVK